MKTKLGLAFALTILALTAAVYAAEYNFYEQADKKGCSSIITERGQDECARVQRAKEDACNIAAECEVDKQERTRMPRTVSIAVRFPMLTRTS
jgi:hypothetical protein